MNQTVCVLIQADLDEVVAGAERAEMVCVARSQLRMLREDRVVRGFNVRPHVQLMRRRLRPRAAIASAVVVSAVRHGVFDGGADLLSDCPGDRGR